MITKRMLNVKLKIKVLTCLVACIFFNTVQAELTLRVGPDETYTTITQAIAAIPQPATENVRIQVMIPAGGYDEDNMDVNAASLTMGSFDLIIEGEDQSAITYYVGDDIEFRDMGTSTEIIENVVAGELIARRAHGSTFDNSREYQYFIKNHLGSTVTLVNQAGTRVGAIYDYFPYGKQVEEAPSSEPLATQTFTGKELDLFEKDAPDGEDGEGWYYFGARYLDADVGRWVSTDPKREFWDLYRYTTNPLSFFDPNGLYEVYVFFDVSMFSDAYTRSVVQQSINKYKKDYGGKDKVKVSFSSTLKSFNDAVKDKDAKYIFYAGHGIETDAGFTFDNEDELVAVSLGEKATEAEVHAYSCFSAGFLFQRAFKFAFPKFFGKSEGKIEFDKDKFKEFMNDLRSTLPPKTSDTQKLK